MDDLRTKKVVNEFVSAHIHHLPRGCQYFRTTCPFCDIITREQTDAYYGILEDMFRDIVETKWNRWDREAYQIANNVSSETLVGHITWHAFSRWLRPRYHDIPEIEPEEITRHPYVLQKIRPNI